MSRGRAIAGDAKLKARVAKVLDALVEKPRDRAKLAKDAASMRARIEREKHAAGPFDVKLAVGGLMDCEFAAQVLVLSGLGRVDGATTLETLTRAAAEGRIESRRRRAAGALRGAAGGDSCSSSASPIRRCSCPTQAPEALKRLMVEVAERRARGCRRRRRAGRGGDVRGARSAACQNPGADAPSA